MCKYAGLDWTGTSTGNEAIYGAAVVVAPSVEVIDEYSAGLRSRWNKPNAFEFHGYQMTEQELWQAVSSVPQPFQIVAALFDRKELRESLGDEYPFSASRIARPALTYLLRSGDIKTLWYDRGDIPGKEAQKRFKTEIARENRTIRNTSPVAVKPLPSEKHSLIQLADVCAYALQRARRGSFSTPELNRIAQTWERDNVHYIVWAKGDDLRPYL